MGNRAQAGKLGAPPRCHRDFAPPPYSAKAVGFQQVTRAPLP